ncbi:unnamed protein product [Gongylonema pulchrum]|uniref:Transmembrane protein n=1 Tax=Gongylonema pulchrum TaxID=637853 RepID=A0A183EW04_9BILA|nr:unnamed protein product [Gongylonema pulchrum]
MLGDFKRKYFDAPEANFLAALFNLLAAALAVSALMCDNWIQVGGGEDDDVGRVDGNRTEGFSAGFTRIAHCKGIGIRHFWRAAKFGSYMDVNGVKHMTYHFGGQGVLRLILELIPGAHLGSE